MDDWSGIPVFGDAPRLGSATVRPSAYGLLTDGRNRLAAVRTPRGYYLPGGGIKQGESPQQAIVRETREECGLSIDVGLWTIRAIDVIFSPAEGDYFAKRSTFMEVRSLQGVVARCEHDHELVWLAVEEALRQLTQASHRWAVGQWEARETRA